MQAHGDPSLLTSAALGSAASSVLPGRKLLWEHSSMSQPNLCFVDVPLELLMWKWDSWALCECECMCMSVRFTLAA